jgi:phosphoglycolate phosphatase
MDNRFEAALFDFDGTLADTGKGIAKCVDYAAEYFGLQTLNDEQRKAFVGPPLYESFRKYFHLEKDEDIITAIEKYRECYVQGAMYDLAFYPGIKELLADMKDAGIKTGVASSKPCGFVKSILEKYGMTALFDTVSCPGDDKIKKTKYELITEAVKILGSDKSKTVMIGDRHFDIDGARAAGVYSVGVLYGYGTAQELEAAGADYIAESVSDVRKAVFSPEYK